MAGQELILMPTDYCHPGIKNSMPRDQLSHKTLDWASINKIPCKGDLTVDTCQGI